MWEGAGVSPGCLGKFACWLGSVALVIHAIIAALFHRIADDTYKMFDDFISFDIAVNGVRIHGVRTDVHHARPTILLLHGYPQSHMIWHRVAPQLARTFNVVATDLRGYGASEKPAGVPDHSNYSKREMARDQIEVMRALGVDRFFVCAHDRGARVAHRMAMDHPKAVKKLVLLDVSPTLAMYEQTSMEFARGYWWWFFLIQPAPFPEKLITAAPEVYLKKKIGYGFAGLAPFSDEAYASYLANVSDFATVHGMCEDYRASATIDLEHDRADRAAGRFMEMPVRALWGEHGIVHRCFKPLDDWARVAREVSGGTVPGGHYIPEELPHVLVQEIRAFFDH
jgi:haloacetate dehalogenase